MDFEAGAFGQLKQDNGGTMRPAIFKTLLSAFFILLLCACQADGERNVTPEQSNLPECQKTHQDNNDYSAALTAYESFLCGDIGLDNNPSFTIAPTPESKYAILDMNNDGIPELAVINVIFQNRNSETLELESASFDSAIFSYSNGTVFIWGGGSHRHNPFEILSNKALLYDCDDGHGGREIIYHELDEKGGIAREIELWSSSDGRYYLTDHAQSDFQVEISEENWQELVDPILSLRTDLILWVDFPENHTEDLATEKLIFLGETRDDGWRCEGTCVNSDGISCESFLVRIASPDRSFFQEIALTAESRTMPTGAAHWEDVNFDGELDVLVHLGGGRAGTEGYAAMIWDETVGSYREEPAYAEIGNPTPDTEHKIVWDGADTSSQFDLSAWEYWNGNLVKTHQLSALYNSPAEQRISLIEYELKDGVFSEIHQSVSIPDDIKGIETYISTYAVWEGWKWCDVKCFQQKG